MGWWEIILLTVAIITILTLAWIDFNTNFRNEVGTRHVEPNNNTKDERSPDRSSAH